MRHKFVRTILPFVVTALTGGLAGSIFSSLGNLQHTTTVTHKLYTKWYGIDDSLRTLLPDAKFSIGDKDVSFYKLTLDFLVQSGPRVESADIYVTFPKKNDNSDIRFYKLKPETFPGFRIDCTTESYGVHCKDVGPLDPVKHHIFRLSIVTDQPHPDEIYSTTKGVELPAFDVYQRRVGIIFCVVMACLLSAMFYSGRRLVVWWETRTFNRSLNQETCRPSEPEYPKIFSSEAERDALNRAFREESRK